MAMDEAESCGSRATEAMPVGAQHLRQQKHQYKLDVYNEVLRRLVESGIAEALSPSFADELWAHFNRLPARYALDVNVERAEDVLTHKQLLDLAHDPAKRPVFSVRMVQTKVG